MSNSRLSPFGEILRAWRKRRGLSQVDLAYDAATTPRNVSLVETGRSRPGHDLVLRFADALHLSLREKNALLHRAGFTPQFSEHEYDDAALESVRRVVDMILANHQPFPAFSFGPGFRVLRSNQAGERFFPGMVGKEPFELIRQWCTPNEQHSAVEASRAAHQFHAALRHELSRSPHPDLPELLALVTDLIQDLPPPPFGVVDPEGPVLGNEVKLMGETVRLLTTVLRFDKATDITMAEIRVELMFPADDVAEDFFRQQAEICSY